MHYFQHERLDVYRVAIDFVANADAIASALPRGRGYLSDQLRRAATSILLNIAEGAGELAGDEKARCYRMARRSGTECAGILDLARRLELAPQGQVTEARMQLLRVVSMLTAMTKRADPDPPEPAATARATATGSAAAEPQREPRRRA